MAFFVADTCRRFKNQASVMSGEVKDAVLKNEQIRRTLSLISMLNIKKCLPVYIVVAMLLVSGLIWAGQAVSANDTALPEGAQPAPALVEQPGNGYREVEPQQRQYRPNEITVSRGRIDRSDRYLMARVIEGEAADEPLVGKVAVGAVIINRTESGHFPRDVRGVVYEPLAFEAVANGQYMRPVTGESLKAADLALRGWDPTGGALYYWNPVTAKSKWVWQKPITKKIGRHVFAE